MILAVLLDGDGPPVCTEMWPGNTADVSSLIPVADRLRKRFSLSRVCIVADRGMISARRSPNSRRATDHFDDEPRRILRQPIVRRRRK
jgi:hypothetical protein